MLYDLSVLAGVPVAITRSLRVSLEGALSSSCSSRSSMSCWIVISLLRIQLIASLIVFDLWI